MCNKLHLYAQYLAPQRCLTRFAGWCAEATLPWFKNFLIKYFVKYYQVNMSEATIEDPFSYASFNDFFTRKIKAILRPIASETNAIISPVDGAISQIGYAKQQTLIQAKGFDFDLPSLLGGNQTLAQTFQDGAYTTLYLAPRDYHRIHMPLDGTLTNLIYVPGKLFSVNRQTAEHIPSLYSRNERLICVFDTSAGKMAVILVGAMIVGSMQVSWINTPITQKTMLTTQIPVSLKKGDELGLFKLGSTVILLFEKNRATWNTALSSANAVQMGQAIGQISVHN